MLNGEERFVLKSISRNDIAAMLNDVIDEKKLAIPLFGAVPDDDRLTSRLCGTFVESLADAYDMVTSEENMGYAEREAVYTFLLVYFK